MRNLILAILLALWATAVSADIWECVDGSGYKRFTNLRNEAKGCKLLNVGPPNTLPSPRPEARSTPPGFPKVDGNTQKQRDNDRRKILEQELAGEERLLAQARKELEEQEGVRLGSEKNYQRVLDRLEPYKKKVKLHEDNVANLRRELAGAK
ncbi:MAG: DUF4124 domain-containing protein [Betaproteobacteria bacterium]|nr:DUF4124 domain-containing protein [Betaproteobacteria bacterium]